MKYQLLTICTLLVWMASGQSFYPPIVNYSTKEFGKERNPENYCVVQDHRGIMYIGNSHGILEFDGETWNFIQVNFGSFVRALAVDDQGVIYVGVYGDFGYLTPNEKGQLTFESLLNEIPEEDRFFSNIWNIHAAGDHVYFQAEEVLFDYQISDEDVAVVYPETSIHTSFLVEDELFLRVREKGIMQYSSGQFELVPGTEIFKDYGVFGIHPLADDSLMIITQELGIYKFKDGGARLLPDLNTEPLTSIGLFGSTRLSDGNFALNTYTNGVFIMNPKGEVVKRLNRDTGIRSDVVQYIYQDRDLNLWLALGNGIAKINYHSPLSYFDEKAGIEGNVEAIIRYKGTVYVGTSYGLLRRDNTGFGSRQFINTGMLKDQVWDFCIVGEKLYIATAKGVFVTTNGTAFRQLNYENTNTIKYWEAQDKFVAAGLKSIVVYDANFKQIWAAPDYYSTFLGIEEDPENSNRVWLGTTKSGSFRLTAEGNSYEIEQYGQFDGLTDNLGKPLIFDNDLIFGAKDGLYHFIDEEDMKVGLTEEELDNPENYRGMFNIYPLYDSIFDGQFLLLAKGEDRVWYCNEYKVGFYDYETKEFKNRPFWGIDYGRINEFYLEDNGVLWIGAADGLIRYEKNAEKVYESEFYSLIREAKLTKDSVIFNGVFVSDSSGFSMEQSESRVPEIEYKYNDIAFLFSAPYFEDEHQPEYRYTLEGYDEGWSDWKIKSEASFNNMHEGAYTFKVEARNIYGQVSQRASYSFVVLPPWYRTTWAYALYGIAFLFILLIGVRISLLRLKAKNAKLEEIVEERTKEISLKNVVLEHQKQEIEDSINYALRIQEAILPLATEVKRWIPDSFVLFRPKDIVSGDFYWFLERDGKLVFICADCTGHGVPGAFMSMIGSDRLNNIVSERKITSPSAILSELNRSIKKSLKQDGEKDSTRDGMDASVCTIDLATGKLHYAGAHRPLWIVHEGELTEIKATKVAVAGFTPDDQVYEEHQIEIKPGMKFYMTTDGYADQFGGERDKKYKVRRMKDFVVRNSGKDFEEQKRKLEQELLDWMGDTEQVDDVCVIGFEMKDK